MIISAIGRPTPRAPPIINANAESKLSSAWTSRFDIALLPSSSHGHRPSPK
jgi:hypothetical protein